MQAVRMEGRQERQDGRQERQAGRQAGRQVLIFLYFELPRGRLHVNRVLKNHVDIFSNHSTIDFRSSRPD